MASSPPPGALVWPLSGRACRQLQISIPRPLTQPPHPLTLLLCNPTRSPVHTVASPCSSSIPWHPCCVVRHDPFALPLAPDLFDSTCPAACLFVFLRLISQPDHDFFPLQKASLCMYNSSIDWWRVRVGWPLPAWLTDLISNRIVSWGVRLRSTRNDAAALTRFLLTLSLSAASFLNSLGAEASKRINDAQPITLPLR
jgi:hypothetical protein